MAKTVSFEKKDGKFEILIQEGKKKEDHQFSGTDKAFASLMASFHSQGYTIKGADLKCISNMRIALFGSKEEKKAFQAKQERQKKNEAEKV